MNILPQIPASLQDLLSNFWWAFSDPSLRNFIFVVTGWMTISGRHTISQAIRANAGIADKHFSAIYRFFSRAVWSPDRVGEILFRLILKRLVEMGGIIYIILDDTLSRKSGPQIWGAGMHHDPIKSTYSGSNGGKAQKSFAFGLNFVVLAIWLPFPWNPIRGIAIPILCRLYRSKKLCPADEYTKRTKLAAELVEIAAGWLDEHLCTIPKVVLLGDGEYACQTVVRVLPLGIEFTGPVLMNAALYEPAPARKPGQRGRPPKKGPRISSPAAMARNDSVAWVPVTVNIYGRKVKLLTKTWTGLWYTVAGARLVRFVLTRDPTGRLDDRAFFSTVSEDSVQDILETFSKRWTIEVTFFNCKQFLGLEDPQNGWGKRKEKPRGKEKPGARPVGKKGEKAIRRTVPIIFITYGIIHLWYFTYGNPERDVALAKRLAPWLRKKTEPSFADMLRAIRRELTLHRFRSYPELEQVPQEAAEAFVEELLAA